jgi:hypothetical protein
VGRVGELAPLYAQRWEFEGALDELKVHQRGPRVVLRSKTPDGVIQEAASVCRPRRRRADYWRSGGGAPAGVVGALPVALRRRD